MNAMSTDAHEPQANLSGQTALVTGASGGLGRAFALALAEAGARVAVTARTAGALAETADMVKRAGGDALAIPGDVAASDDVARVVRTVESQLGPIDILINNAGVVGPLGYDWQVDPNDWWRTFEINLQGPFRCARAVVPSMITRKRGRIINVSSGAGFSRLPQMGAYCASKAALTQWTKTLAEDIKAHGIVVFAFGPGFVSTTPMGARATASDTPKALTDLFQALLSQGRAVPIERCARMLLFLVSGRADALSGRFIRAQDDERDLVVRAAEIQRDDLHTVTLRA